MVGIACPMVNLTSFTVGLISHGRFRILQDIFTSCTVDLTSLTIVVSYSKSYFPTVKHMSQTIDYTSLTVDLISPKEDLLSPTVELVSSKDRSHTVNLISPTVDIAR